MADGRVVGRAAGVCGNRERLARGEAAAEAEKRSLVASPLRIPPFPRLAAPVDPARRGSPRPGCTA